MQLSVYFFYNFHKLFLNEGLVSVLKVVFGLKQDPLRFEGINRFACASARHSVFNFTLLIELSSTTISHCHKYDECRTPVESIINTRTLKKHCALVSRTEVQQTQEV